MGHLSVLCCVKDCKIYLLSARQGHQANLSFFMAKPEEIQLEEDTIHAYK